MLLTFDTSLDKTYIGLADGYNLLGTKVLENKGSTYHSTYLMSSITELLKENNLTPQDITEIATNVGPGSFTGIRACTTVARVMAQQLGCKVLGVSSLEILSRVKRTGKKPLVLLDARKNMAYVWDEEVLGAIAIDDVKEMVKADEYSVICDDNMYKIFSEITDDIVSYTTLNANLAEILISIVNERKNELTTDWRMLTPLYIQPPPVFGK